MNHLSNIAVSPTVDPYEGEEKYIFVSYCRKDSDKVFEIVNALHEQGYRIWYDGGIHAGQNFLESLATKVKNCTIFIAFLSKDYVEHKYCRKELDHAFRHEKTIIPIMLEKFELPDSLVFQMDCINWRRVSNNSGKTFAEELCRVDGNILDPCRINQNREVEPVGLVAGEDDTPSNDSNNNSISTILQRMKSSPQYIILILAVIAIAWNRFTLSPQTRTTAPQSTEELFTTSFPTEETVAPDPVFSAYEQKQEAKSSAFRYLACQIQETGIPLASYESDNQAIFCASYTYDNAMVALAFQSEGDYGSSAQILDALIEGMKNDPEFNDRFRNAYMTGDAKSVPGWWDETAEQWCQDPYQIGTSTQATCAAAVALLRHNSVEKKKDYVDAASSAVSWILENCRDATSGFTAGYDGWPNADAATTYTYKSTVDNLWLYVACKQLYEETEWDIFAQSAESAREFVAEAMYSAADTRFYLGTDSDGYTPRTDNLVIPVQALTALALGDCSGLNNIFPKEDGGYPYLSTKSPGSWVEGTAMAALAFRKAGENQKSQDALDALVRFQLRSGGFPQATVASLETGETGRSYSDIPETAPCAWFIMAVNGFNPME